MAVTVITKNSTVAGKVPDSLATGELAINLADKKLFSADQDNNVFEIETGSEVIVADAAPAITDLTPGQLWFNSNDGRLYVLYEDTDSTQWVDASPDMQFSEYWERTGTILSPVQAADKVTSASTAADDPGNTLATKDYVDTSAGALDLQAVTDNGNTTTNDIEVAGITAAGLLTVGGSGSPGIKLNPAGNLEANPSSDSDTAIKVFSNDQNQRTLDINGAGDVKIGGTLLLSPNIELNASDGTITATGDVKLGGLNTGSTTTAGANLRSPGILNLQRPSTTPTNAEFIYGYFGTTETFRVEVSGDIKTSGSVSIGGTDAAHTIDEYEEGIWTPAVNNMTTTGSPEYGGTYTKIGRLVTIYFYSTTAGGVATYQTVGGSTNVSGLPFLSRYDGPGASGGPAGSYVNGNTTDGGFIQGPNESGTTFYFSTGLSNTSQGISATFTYYTD